MTMRASARALWLGIAKEREGYLNRAYLDTLGYLTFGIGRKGEYGGTPAHDGQLAEGGAPTVAYLVQPWRDKNGDLVLESSIREEFARIKARGDLAHLGGGADEWDEVATLDLADEFVLEQFDDVTAEFWATLVKGRKFIDVWPADAQLAIMDMAYQNGPNFLATTWRNSNFRVAVDAEDFRGMVKHAPADESKPGARGQMRQRLFANALASEAFKMSPDVAIGPDKPVVEISEYRLAKPSVRNVDVFLIQLMLSQAGKTIYVDGIKGPQTTAAFKAYGGSLTDTATLVKLSKATLAYPTA